MPTKTTVWTPERRLAFGVLGRLAVEGVLTDEVLVNGSSDYIPFLVDTLANGLRADLLDLGANGTLREVLHAADVGSLYLDRHSEVRHE